MDEGLDAGGRGQIPRLATEASFSLMEEQMANAVVRLVALLNAAAALKAVATAGRSFTSDRGR